MMAPITLREFSDIVERAWGELLDEQGFQPTEPPNSGRIYIVGYDRLAFRLSFAYDARGPGECGVSIGLAGETDRTVDLRTALEATDCPADEVARAGEFRAWEPEEIERALGLRAEIMAAHGLDLLWDRELLRRGSELSRVAAMVNTARLNLSEAMVLWTDYRKNPWPRQDNARLVTAFGAERAAQILPLLKAVESEVWEVTDREVQAGASQSHAAEQAAASLREHHPELSEQAIAAVLWSWSYHNR